MIGGAGEQLCILGKAAFLTAIVPSACASRLVPDQEDGYNVADGAAAGKGERGRDENDRANAYQPEMGKWPASGFCHSPAHVADKASAC